MKGICIKKCEQFWTGRFYFFEMFGSKVNQKVACIDSSLRLMMKIENISKFSRSLKSDIFFILQGV